MTKNLYKRKLIKIGLIWRLIKMRSVVFSVLYLKGYFNRKESTHTLILISLYIYRIFKVSIRHTNVKTTQKLTKTNLKILYNPL